MSTIALFSNKINCMNGFFSDTRSQVLSFKDDLNRFESNLMNIDTDCCNLESVSAKLVNSQNHFDEMSISVDTLASEMDDFIQCVCGIDDNVNSLINQRKNDFYEQYSYLKPKEEKTLWDKAGDALQSAEEWCKKHWKTVATIIIVVVAIIGLAILSAVTGGGILVLILTGACIGAISGALIGGIISGLISLKNKQSFWEGFENGAFSGAVGGAIGGAITGGLSFAIGPASSLLNGILQGAGIGAVSSGFSNMCVTAIDYVVTHHTLRGSLDDILLSGLSGVISGGIMGGIMGGVQFKITVKSIEKYGLKVEKGKVEGKISIDEYLKYRKMSINNPNSDTMTLGKYEPTILPDRTPDYSVPGPGAYTQKAGDTTYFSLGTEWDNITSRYNLDSAGKDMFKLFNQPALDDAVNAGKMIRFSHDPTAYGKCALKWEWDYLKQKHDYSEILQIGDFWYGIK